MEVLSRFLTVSSIRASSSTPGCASHCSLPHAPDLRPSVILMARARSGVVVWMFLACLLITLAWALLPVVG